jgi:hypothetical protein
MGTGISTDDFTQILSDFTRTVSYKVVTITNDQITGDETTTFASASDTSVVFFKTDSRFMFDKEGLMEVGDAYIMVPLSKGIKRYDQFTIDGDTYYIDNVINRYVLGVEMFDYGVCFLVG